MTRREQALASIRVCGYHEDPAWVRIYCESRGVSREAAEDAYMSGRRARVAGVRCNCRACAPKTLDAPA